MRRNLGLDLLMEVPQAYFLVGQRIALERACLQSQLLRLEEAEVLQGRFQELKNTGFLSQQLREIIRLRHIDIHLEPHLVVSQWLHEVRRIPSGIVELDEEIGPERVAARSPLWNLDGVGRFRQRVETIRKLISRSGRNGARRLLVGKVAGGVAATMAPGQIVSVPAANGEID